MIFLNEVLIQVATFVLGFLGFWIAKHIRDHKVDNKTLVCMVGFDCHAVIHSDYSKFFGIPVEVFGMMYYALIFSLYFVFTVFQALMPDVIIGALILMSFTAFLFSLYLILVQIFILKKGCSWCIVSAFISLIIFILTMMHYDFSFIAGMFVK